MSYSRRQLEALGEPLGDSVTRKEGGRIIYGGGGGGGSGTQTQVTDLPEWAKPYAQKTLGLTEATLFTKDTDPTSKTYGDITGFKPYQSYGQWAQKQGFDPTQVAGFQPLQQRAFGGAENLQPSAAMGMGMGLAGTAASRALGMQYDPTRATYMQAQAPQLQQFQMGPAERVGADVFGSQTAASYMSPYIEQAMEPQLREAARSSEMQRQADQARAVGMGAFGGSRQAIVEAERQRNLGTQLGDIRARGLQSAYEQAAQQFNQDAARRLQAQQLNQQAGLTVGGQNLQALLGTQQLGAQTGLQAQLANQQAFQQARQLAEQSRQYGAGLGLQGLQTALQGAGQLGQLGAQEFGQAKDVIGLQSQLGAQQQQLEQARINALMQDYQAQQRYPYQQLEFMSNILRGTPMGTVQTLYGAQPTMAQNIASLGMGAYGIGQLMRAEGGTVSSYAEGGSVTDERNVDDILDKLSDAQLYQARDMAMSRKDAAQVAQIDKELAQRASLRSGLGGAFNTIPQDRQEQMMAGGGIVAFAGDEDENDDETGQMVSEPRIPVGRGDLPTYGAAMRGLTDLYAQFKGDKGWSPLSAEEEKTMYDRSVTRGKEIYGDVLSKIKANIESERGMGEENLRQQRGLAALSAAEGMLQGRGFMRGLAQAGGAFGRTYSKALEADAAQKRALTNMELNLAKAEADQRMGLHDKAEARIAKANADRKAAHTAQVNKTRAEADLLYKMGRVSMPPAPTKAGGGPKLSPDERIAAKAELIALGKDKFMGQTGPEASAAYLESIGKSAAARTGARYTGPDKTFDRQVKLQQLYSNDPQLKAYAESLAMAQLSNNPQRVKTLQDAITAREAALAKTLPEVPGAAPKSPPAARITPEEFNKRWASLKPGQTLEGPDGVTYTKQQTQ